MKSIQIKNFQCFRDSSLIPFHKLTIFIGENDCGKSAILRALEIFLNNKPMNPNYFHRIHDDEKKLCEIEIVFTSLHANRKSFPKQFIVNGEVAIKKIFNLDEGGKFKTQVKAFAFEKSELNDISSLKAGQLKEIFAELGLVYTNISDAQIILRNYIQDHFEDLQKQVDWIDINWNDIKDSLPIFEYYNSSSIGNPVQIVANTLKSVYRSHFYDVDDEGKETLKNELTDKKGTIIQELNNKIENELNQKIKEKNPRILNIHGDYSIDFASGFQLNNLLADFGQGFRDIDTIGEGSKKRLFLAITEWDKEIRSKGSYRKVIRGYDEPDTSLHYKAQKEIFLTLQSLSESEEINVQPILCTHSLTMIDRASPKSINHIKIKSGESYVEYLKGEDDRDIKEFLDQVSEISGFRNSSLFFERCFLIVEGLTEFNSLPIIYKKFTRNYLNQDGVVLINLESNGAWKSFLKLLSCNKKNSTILFLDYDIQEDGRRNLTEQKLREVGFGEDFLATNVIFAGEKEYEDIFSDNQICRCLNQYYPKIDENQWTSSEITKLRSEGKFSKNLQNLIGRYNQEHGIRDQDFKKPEFGERMAKMLTNEEIREIPPIVLLIEKISQITN